EEEPCPGDDRDRQNEEVEERDHEQERDCGAEAQVEREVARDGAKLLSIGVGAATGSRVHELEARKDTGQNTTDNGVQHTTNHRNEIQQKEWAGDRDEDQDGLHRMSE